VAITGLPDRVPGRVIFPRGGAPLAGEAVRMTPPLLAMLEEWFGSPYPFEKLDLIAVPEYWYGAMENVGLITFREERLLIDPRSASVEDRRRLAGILAHEIAHHWFGNLVTMDWWDDLWLNEAFAYWIDGKATARTFPELASEVEGVRGAQMAMTIDSRRSTRIIREPVTSLPNLLRASDSLTNQKGEAVLRMVEAWLGEDVFRDGVRTYLSRHAWGNAVAADFWDALGEVSRQPVPAVLSSFLDQPGVPLVSVEPAGGGKVRLQQTRLLVPPGGGPPPQRWTLPVQLRYPSERGEIRTQRVLLGDQVAIVQLTGRRSGEPPRWIHANSGEVGYYRWRVPRKMLERLTDEPTATLSVRERVALVGHLDELVGAELEEPTVYLSLLERFAADPSPEVVARVARAVGEVHDLYYDPAIEEAMARWIGRLLWPALERIGTAPRPGEPAAVADLRPTLLRWLGAVAARPEVVAWARETAERVLAAPASVDGELAEAALAVAAAHGDAALFARVLEHFERSATPQERSLFLGALGAFDDPALADRALAYTLEGKLRPQELRTIPVGLRSRPRHEQRVFEWSLRNYPAVAGRIPPAFMIYMPYYAGGCSRERLDRAVAFYSQPEHAPPGTAGELAKVAEGVEACLRMRQRGAAAVRAFLARDRD
jgi:alanyl aminopeptidase